jgi:hypothetical protein
MRVLGIAGSPRLGGNTETLLDWCLDAAEAEGAEVTKFRLREMDIGYCRACDACFADGVCNQRDDMHALYPHLRSADSIVLASPVYSMGVPALPKAMIDRCQPFWALKYVLKRPLDRRAADADALPPTASFDSAVSPASAATPAPAASPASAATPAASATPAAAATPAPERLGAFLCCSGTSFTHVFEGTRQVIRYLWHVLEVKPAGELLCPGVDLRGEILEHPSAKAVAEDIGRRLGRIR